MHATQVLHNCIQAACQEIHRQRFDALFAAVEALSRGQRLSLTGLGRTLNSPALVKHNIKRMDRLIGNEVLFEERTLIYSAAMQWVIGPSRRPVLVVDISDLTSDRRYQMLRAAVPVGGRTLTVYEEVHPRRTCDSLKVKKRFLAALKEILPEGCRPILVTDAGFRGPWFKAVERLGWDWVGRIRNRTLCRWQGEDQWVPCKQLYPLATARPKHLGRAELTYRAPLDCDLYLVRRKKKGRVRRTRSGKRAQSAQSKKIAQREREPWLLATSLGAAKAKKIIELYGMRMQIEEGFRDTKNQRLGFSLNETRTQQCKRLALLLLIGTLATLALWLLGKAGERCQLHYQFQANTTRSRPVLSTFFLGCQLVQRPGISIPSYELKRSFRQLHSIVEGAFTA